VVSGQGSRGGQGEAASSGSLHAVELAARRMGRHKQPEVATLEVVREVGHQHQRDTFNADNGATKQRRDDRFRQRFQSRR